MLARRTPLMRTGWRRRAGVSPETPVASMRPVAPAPPVTRLSRPANYAPATGHATALKKDAPARSEAYRRIVAAMPCAACGIAGYSQHAHANEGKGMGMKRAPFKRKNNAENIQSKVAQSHAQQARVAIISIAKSAKNGPSMQLDAVKALSNQPV